MNPLTSTLKFKVQRHIDIQLTALSKDWMSGGILECGSIDAVESLEQRLLMCGSLGLSIPNEDRLIKCFHPSLFLVLNEFPSRKQALIESFCLSLFGSLSGEPAAKTTVDKDGFTANRFKPVLSVELLFNGTTPVTLYLFPDFVDKHWPIHVSPKGGLTSLGTAQEVLHTNSLGLHVSAGTITLTFQETLNLEKGQVFVSDIPVSRPFEVKHNDNILFHSYLGRKANKKAIVVR